MENNNRLRNIFKDLFSLNDLEKESEINTKKIKDWDSLNHLNLIISIEKEFDIDIPPDDFPELFSDIKTIMKYIERKIK